MWKKVATSGVVIGVLYIIRVAMVANGVYDMSQIFTNKIALENINYVIQIVCGIFLIVGTFIAVWQYILSAKDSKMNKDREFQLHQKEVFEMEKDRIQRAIDLSGYYKDFIIKDITILRTVYSATGVLPILDKINFSDIKYFDKHEMENVISTDDREKIKNVTRDKKMIDALTLSSEVTGLWQDCKEVINIKKDNQLVREVTVSPDAMIYRFKSMVRDLLNNLEYFSMNFTHGTADDSVVYQSLHKTYIETVQNLYYDIAANNQQAESKLFTNIIELYNQWVEQAKRQKENEIAATRETVIKGNTLKTT